MPKKLEETKGKENGIVLTDSETREFWKSLSSSEVVLNDTETYDYYEEFVNIQKPSFVAALEKVNTVIEKLKLEGKVSEYAKWEARIKHFENALKNASINKEHPDSGKALDDVFGVRIKGAAEAELAIIRAELEKEFAKTGKKKDSINTLYNIQRIAEISNITHKELARKSKKGNDYSVLSEIFKTVEAEMEKTKEIVKKIHEREKRKKDSRSMGYNAVHRYYYDKNDEMSPIIEFQFWTAELDYECTHGKLSYTNYKDLSKEMIQQMYDQGMFRIGYNIPTVYEGRNGKIYKLSSEEALKKIYPFLNMNKTRSQDVVQQAANTIPIKPETTGKNVATIKTGNHKKASSVATVNAVSLDDDNDER